MIGILLAEGLLICAALVALLGGTMTLTVISKTAPHSAAQRRNVHTSRLNGVALCLVGFLLLLAGYFLVGHLTAQVSTALLVLGGGIVVAIAVLLLISVGMALNVIGQPEQSEHDE